MKILMINSVCGIGSTGRICTDIAQELEKQGHQVKIAYGRKSDIPKKFEKYAVCIGGNLSVLLHGAKARLFDASGFGSKRETRRFVNWIIEYDPDVIHLHNLHGYYINVEILFNYLRNCDKRIIWTLHDCWGFTGHCTHFEYEKCIKWKTCCSNCAKISEYPKSFIDRSTKNYIKKKYIFTGIKNMSIIVPSEWLKKKVKESFLNEYEVEVIRNGIDLSVFHKRDSNLRKKFNLINKKIILGVSSVWNKKKGLDAFCSLARTIDNNEYQIVLIGIEGKQKKYIPDNIICIQKTNNVEELVEWYSVADIFINLTLEDTYPTTNLEAIACETPVISFKTGGSPESAVKYGVVIDKLEDIFKYLDVEFNLNENSVSFLSKKTMKNDYLKLYLKS